MTQARCFGLSRQTEEIRRGKPLRIPGDALADSRVERPDVADEQIGRPQHTLKEAGAVELCRVETAVTQQPGQMSRREVLVPALGNRDVSDQTFGVADVSFLIIGL